MTNREILIINILINDNNKVWLPTWSLSNYDLTKIATKKETIIYNKCVEEFKAYITKHNEIKQFKNNRFLMRYFIIGAISNISLSVHPTLKSKWKISHEMYGNQWNTNYPYCSLFNDENSDNRCNAYNYIPNKNDIILCNPPYTTEHIISAINRVLYILNNYSNITYYIIIPIWDKNTRKKLKYTIEYNDINEINILFKSKYLKQHYTKKLLFYNGFTKKSVKLKDKVHVFIMNNN